LLNDKKLTFFGNAYAATLWEAIILNPALRVSMLSVALLFVFLIVFFTRVY